MASRYIEAVKEYADILKSDAETPGFPITKKLIAEIKKVGVEYFGDDYVDTFHGEELDGTLYESDLEFDEEENFKIMNKKEVDKEKGGDEEEDNENEDHHEIFENYAWLSDAWGFSLLIDISDKENPKYFPNPKLGVDAGSDTVILWRKAAEKGLNMSEIVNISKDNAYNIIGITVEQ